MKHKVLAILLVSMIAIPFAAKASDPISDEQRMGQIRNIMQERQEKKSANEAEGLKGATPDSSSDGRIGMRMLEGLFLCLGVFFIGVYVYRKKTGDTPHKRSGRLKIVDRMMVAPKTSLVLAEVDGREVLFAVGSEPVSFFPATNTRNEGSNDLGLICRETDTLPVAMHS